MHGTADLPEQDRRVQQLVDSLGPPFAKALAVFVEELSRHEQSPTSVDAAPSGSSGGVFSALPARPLPESWDDLSEAARRELEAEIRRNNALLAAGELEAVEFTEDSPAIAAANRLRRVARAKGVSQKELAERLGVSASSVSKVFRNPDRSKVATLRKIADALGVELREIV